MNITIFLLLVLCSHITAIIMGLTIGYALWNPNSPWKNNDPTPLFKDYGSEQLPTNVKENPWDQKCIIEDGDDRHSTVVK